MGKTFAASLVAFSMAMVSLNAAAAPPTEAEMRGYMKDWFDGEQREAYVFLGAGVLSLGGGIYLATRDDDLPRGAGYSLAVVGGLMTVFSITYSLSLSPRHDDLKDQLDRDPVKYKREETDRMDAIADRFVMYRWAEIGLIAVGGGLITYGVIEDKDLFTGIGIGLAAEAALVLFLDYFAERRTHTYLDHLKDFDPAGSSATPLKRRPFVLSYGGRFQ